MSPDVETIAARFAGRMGERMRAHPHRSTALPLPGEFLAGPENLEEAGVALGE